MENTDKALASILNQLSSKFGTTVDHLYAIMIKQAFIDGVESIAGIILTLIISSILSIIIYKGYKNHTPKRDYFSDSYWDENFFLTAIWGIMLLITIMTICIAGSTAINCFFNPEYYALHQIIK